MKDKSAIPLQGIASPTLEDVANLSEDEIMQMVIAEIKQARKKAKVLEKLKAKPDDEIDLSDIPEITEEMWKTAVRGKFYRPVKEQVTVRIDADVLAWLKQRGKGYQTRLNEILRDAMLEDHKA